MLGGPLPKEGGAALLTGEMRADAHAAKMPLSAAGAIHRSEAAGRSLCRRRPPGVAGGAEADKEGVAEEGQAGDGEERLSRLEVAHGAAGAECQHDDLVAHRAADGEIGRASCRERV